MITSHKRSVSQIAHSPSPSPSGRVGERFLIVLLVLFLTACNPGSKTTVTELFPVKVGTQFGYMDRTGKMVIAPQFSQAGCFSDGIAYAAVGDDKWGYINTAGKFVIDPTYQNGTSFSEGLAFVVTEDGGPVAIDKTGTVKFKTKDVEEVGYFCEGYAAFSVLTDAGEKWGFMDKEGTTKITTQFTGVSFFSGGMCAVIDDEGKWGFIDKKGDLKIKYQYDNVAAFTGNRAAVCVDGKWGAIDNTGKYLVDPQYADMHMDQDGFVVADGDKFGWLDNSGKVVITPQFERAFPFNGGKLAPVRIGGKWGYIDHSGNVVVQPQYDFAFGFDGNMALVQQNHKEGFINESGALSVPISFDDMSPDYYTHYFVGISSASSVITNANQPLFVAYKWLTRFFMMDFETAKSYSTEDTKNLIDQFAGVTNLMPDSSKQELMSIKVAVIDPKENGDKAVVTYATSDNPAKAQTLYLVKEKGKWHVQFSKDDAANSGVDNTADAAEKPAE
jgi:hypothetical protein